MFELIALISSSFLLQLSCCYCYLEILDAADGAVVLAERVVEHDAGPLAGGELGLAEEGDPAAFRAADPNLKRKRDKNDDCSISSHQFMHASLHASPSSKASRLGQGRF